MKTLSIDIETYSDVPLQKTGVYRYVESPDFEILLFAYSVDSQPVQVIDLACGEQIPKEILLALEDECVIKWAFNATFERICLSRFLGYPIGEYLKPESWRCSMIWSATMGLPLSLEGVGAVLGLEGTQFLVADFSAIEARVIAWFASEKWRQDVFAKGGDIYCASASQAPSCRLLSCFNR